MTMQCSKSLCLDDIADCRRDVYAKCTLPVGHDGPHRVFYEDDWKRITLTFEGKDLSDD